MARHVRRRGIRVVRVTDARTVFVPSRYCALRAAARRGKPVTAMVAHGADGSGLESWQT